MTGCRPATSANCTTNSSPTRAARRSSCRFGCACKRGSLPTSGRSPRCVARALTQAQLAKALNVSQAQVSRIEHQADLYLSTLESYIAAMGGSLELVAVFDDTRVVLTLSELADTSQDTPADLATTA